MAQEHRCHVCALSDHDEPATQLVRYVEFDNLYADWVCDDCAEQCIPQALKDRVLEALLDERGAALREPTEDR